MGTTNSLALILISLGLFFLVGKPAFSDISRFQAEKQEYTDAIEQINSFESKKDELLTKLNNISPEDRQKMETFLPTKEGIVRLIADIDGIAAKRGIGIESANIVESKTDISRSVSEAPQAEIFGSKTIDITFASNYDALINFLNDLEKSLRVIDVRAINFSQGAELTTVYHYRVSLEVYWLKNLPYNQNDNEQ